MTVLGIIPARGGSKGVPRKNIRPLAGKPLICHTIEAAQQSHRISRLVVSTDDAEIAAVAEGCGGLILMRPPELAGDTTPMVDVVRHVLNEHQQSFEILLLLQPTCPQRTAKDIDQALDLFHQPLVRSVISVYQVEDHHPARMYRLDGKQLVPLYPDWLAARRQDLPPVYHRNGAIYACRTHHFLQTGSLWDDRPAAYVMPLSRSLNIDAPQDFALAEFLFGKG